MRLQQARGNRPDRRPDQGTACCSPARRSGDLMHGRHDAAKDAKKWFGAVPPDLSVIARAKSVNAGPPASTTCTPTCVRSTATPAGATGWNNLVFPNVGMPHAPVGTPGPARAHHRGHARGRRQGRRSRLGTRHHGVRRPGLRHASRTSTWPSYHGHATFELRFKAANPAQSRPATTTTSRTSPPSWPGWPSRWHAAPQAVGVWVLIFLGLFLVVALRLNASYWKHVR